MRVRAPGTTGPEPCRARLVVLDFDGTLTDADAHAPAFFAASRAELARRLGTDEAALRPEWERERAAVAALQPGVAWVVDGFGVCPAAADPYMIANGASRRLLVRRHAGEDEAGIIPRVLEVHHAAYRSTPPGFRTGARELLEGLLARGCVVRVVTNSRTEPVERLLDTLGLAGRAALGVHGDARKFTVGPPAAPDPRFAALPATVEWPEVGRPVHLERGCYFDVLRAMWDETGLSAESTLVVGDILELDLAMPAALGANVHLALRDSTLPHEARLVRRLARGDASHGLAAVLERLRD